MIRSLLLLFSLSVCWYFANGTWSLDVFAWIYPALTLLFLHRSELKRPGLWLLLVNIPVQVVAWHDMIPIPGVGYYAMTATFALYYCLPFLLDKWLRSRLPGFLKTLVLPCAAVAVEFAMSSFSPYGTNGSVAYTQSDFLPFLQVLSVTGLSGVVFLLYWFGSLLFHVFFEKNSGKILLLPAALYLAIILLGFLRVQSIEEEELDLPVSALVIPVEPLYEELGRQRIDLTIAAPPPARANLNEFQDRYFQELERLIEQDAPRLIATAEANLPLLGDQVARFRQRAAAFSQQWGVAIVHGVVIYTPGEELSYNQAFVFDENGLLQTIYDKSFIVPGDGNHRMPARYAVQQFLGTKMGTAICFDLDFADWVSAFGRQGIGLMVSPASDWAAVDPYHGIMARYRAIENGFSLLRPTHKATSYAVDATGRELFSVRYEADRAHSFHTNISTAPLKTVYPHTRDAFAWLCVLVIVGMMGWTIAIRR